MRDAVHLLALTGSVAVHFAAALAAIPFLAPTPVPQQQGGESQITLAAMQVKRNRALEQAPEPNAAEAASAGGTRAGGQAVPRRRADPLRTSGRVTSAIVTPTDRAIARTTREPPRAAAQTTGIRAAQLRQESIPIPPAKPSARARVASLEEIPKRVQPVEVAADMLLGTGLASRVAPRVREGPPTTTASPVRAKILTPRPTLQPPSEPLIPQATNVAATLDWSGVAGMALDTQSVATLSAFLRPGAVEGGDLRDRMAQVMATPPCARVHTIFDPETGALELRGHVPDPSVRAPLLAALRAQVGAGLPLRDAMRILPQPQCGLLDGIAALGLPQSEEQLTDPDLVGENAQVREYTFSEGDRLTIALKAPDYPSYVYIDYFDAVGQVIHLRPNSQSPLQAFAPAQAFAIGGPGDLDLRIAPPFGQDIAVAFAVSAPLYESLRPLTEPAAPYLDELRASIAARRAGDPEFRGEWVYLFVATQPR